MIEVDLVPAAAANDSELLSWLTDLVNRVYRVAESGMWVEGASRTAESDITGFIEAGEIAVARYSGELAGCVRIQRLDDGAGEFGMLAADPERRGVGLGRELVAFAERTCRANGLTVMQLELLVPREWIQPSKEFLRGWYSRIGYRYVRTGAIEEAYPDLAPLLATVCDFEIYRKDLA